MQKLERLIEYGLYLLVFLVLPVQTRFFIKRAEIQGINYEFGNISIYATDILLIILLTLLVLFILNKKQNSNTRSEGAKKFRISNFWYLIAGLELLAFISIFVASDKLVAAQGYLRLLLGIGLFWLIITASYKKIKLLLALIAGVVTQALLAIWQFLTQSSFSSTLLGLAEHNAGDLGVSIIETLAGGRWLRAYGGLDHPNILGGFLAFGVLITVSLIIYTQSNKKKEFKIQNSTASHRAGGQAKFKIIFLIFVCVLLAGLFFSFSRGAWGGLICGLLTLLIISLVRKEKTKQIILLKLILIFSLVIIVLFSWYQPLVMSRLSKDTRPEIKSVEERVSSYRIASELLKDNWLFGVGIGNYGLTVKEEIEPAGDFFIYQPIHNVFLLVFSEVGIIGFSFYLAMLLYIFIQLARKLSRQEDSSCYCLSFVAFIFPIMLVDHYFWSLHFGVLLFWLIFGLILSKENTGKTVKTIN